MQPKPTEVTLSPVFPRMRYSRAGVAEPAWGGAGGGSVERAADAAAGKASRRRRRKLRREAVRFMGDSYSI